MIAVGKYESTISKISECDFYIRFCVGTFVSERIFALALPKDKLGHLMTIVSRLGSRPDKLLNSDEPGPGETRKLLLAIGMTYTPHIIIMDEPTNHMDLPSIECLEQALKDCPCSLLLVSHDRYFLSRLTSKEWNITPDMDSSGRYVLRKL